MSANLDKETTIQKWEPVIKLRFILSHFLGTTQEPQNISTTKSPSSFERTSKHAIILRVNISGGHCIDIDFERTGIGLVSINLFKTSRPALPLFSG